MYAHRSVGSDVVCQTADLLSDDGLTTARKLCGAAAAANPAASRSVRGGRADKSIVSAQIAACSLILDRGCGRAGQSLAIAIDLKKRLTELTHEVIEHSENDR